MYDPFCEWRLGKEVSERYSKLFREAYNVELGNKSTNILKSNLFHLNDNIPNKNKDEII